MGDLKEEVVARLDRSLGAEVLEIKAYKRDRLGLGQLGCYSIANKVVYIQVNNWEAQTMDNAIRRGAKIDYCIAGNNAGEAEELKLYWAPFAVWKEAFKRWQVDENGKDNSPLTNYIEDDARVIRYDDEDQWDSLVVQMREDLGIKVN